MATGKCQFCGVDDAVIFESETPLGTFRFCKLCNIKVCRLCQNEAELETHHCSYLYDITIEVCPECHGKIHQENGFHDELKPEITRKRAKELGIRHTFVS